MPHPGRTVRIEFTKEHDSFLVKYLAKYHPKKEGRSGNKPFKRLVANEDKRWPWSVHHSWQSWRERYVKHSEHFDKCILQYLQKHDAKEKGSVEKRKRGDEPTPIEMLGPSAKRVKREEEGEEEEGPPSSEIRASTQHENASASRPKPTAKSLPKNTRELPETPSRAPNSTRSTSVRRTDPALPPRSDANASVSGTKEPIPEPTILQTHDSDDTVEILLSSPNRQAPFTKESRSSPRHAKRRRRRLERDSEVFVSLSPSPRMDVTAVGPSSQDQPAPSAPSTGADDVPVATSVYPRVPPRVVDSLHGQVLVNQQGHVPHAFPHGDKSKAEEEEEEEDKARWPPARSRTAKQRRTSKPDVAVDAHHAFSQPLPLPRAEASQENVEVSERERAKPLLHRRDVVALCFPAREGVVPQMESERQGDVVRNGASPANHVVTAAPPSDPFSDQILKRLPKALKFPAPRASTRSPFRPDPPAGKTHRTPPEPQSQLRTKVARHPALTRIRRQTIANGHGNGNRHERERWHEVPSVDLVALSDSRSHSRSSGTSVPARPARWSLPAFAQAMPWVFDEPGYGDIWHGRTRTSSLMGTSTPLFRLTPSPGHSIPDAATNGAARASGIPAHTSPSVSTSLTPHPTDLPLTASHGLASILAHMSANHGLALGVVEAVYKRVGSLREADEVLGGMREAAEGFGEREIERRVMEQRAGRGEGYEADQRRRSGRGEWGSGNGRTELRYVVASEDGEGSEYSPPETSRAAMWKRHSESASYAEEGTREDEDEEAEEGRAVEEELRTHDEDDGDAEDGVPHEFSRYVPLTDGDDEMTGQDRDKYNSAPQGDARRVTEALLEDTRFAQQLERKLGKARYRMDVAKLFG